MDPQQLPQRNRLSACALLAGILFAALAIAAPLGLAVALGIYSATRDPMDDGQIFGNFYQSNGALIVGAGVGVMVFTWLFSRWASRVGTTLTFTGVAGSAAVVVILGVLTLGITPDVANATGFGVIEIFLLSSVLYCLIAKQAALLPEKATVLSIVAYMVVVMALGLSLTG